MIMRRQSPVSLLASMIRLVAPLVGLLLCCITVDERGNLSQVHGFTVTVTRITTRTPTVVSPHSLSSFSSLYATSATTAATTEDDRATAAALKEELLVLLGGTVSPSSFDSENEEGNDSDEEFIEETLYVDPITKQPLRKRVLPSQQLIVGGTGGTTTSSPTTRVQTYEFIVKSRHATSPPTKYVGTSDTYINLLEPYTNDKMINNDVPVQESMQRLLLPFVPIPLRSLVMNNKNNPKTDVSSSPSSSSSSSTYIPMRDLFTSPTVSYLYERGWRQGFTQAGFPGVDTESIMAYDYLQPSLIGSSSTVGSNGILVDMSCATGLFTRKFLRRALLDDSSSGTDEASTLKQPIIRHLIGADYSDAMLREARQRINSDQVAQELLRNYTSPSIGKPDFDFKFDLVRLDVGMIPMRDNSVDAVHAGAAMHCWPDIDLALSEIYRILRPQGGRYFATTFLANYFRNTQQLLSRGNNNQRQQIQEQTFQYFQSSDELRTLLMKAGFSNHQIQIDVVGPSCVIIRCEK